MFSDQNDHWCSTLSTKEQNLLRIRLGFEIILKQIY